MEKVSLIDEVHNVRFDSMTFIVGAGGILNAIGYNNPGSRLKFTNKGQASASITFPYTAEVFPGDPVFPTLLKCSQLVSEALNEIEAVVRRYLANPHG